jgi:two-component sensor histidine kinase
LTLVRDPEPSAPPHGDRFKQILDAAPVAIAVAELQPAEHIIYANDEFERLTGRPQAELVGGGWDGLPGALGLDGMALGELVSAEHDYLGVFTMPKEHGAAQVDAWTSVIANGEGPIYRMLALVEVTAEKSTILEVMENRVREKDAQLRELQHRVKNNLAMITALIRAEARGVPDRTTSEGYERLAGRIEALGVLYRALADSGSEGSVDLGIYLTDIASAVMAANASDGVTLDLKVDSWPVPVDIAMPLGLVVNELITNALKHAFTGRAPGTVTLHSTTGPNGWTVVVADDGNGLPTKSSWPKPGKLSSIIVRALLDNAKARSQIVSEPGQGTRVVFEFDSIKPDDAGEG